MIRRRWHRVVNAQGRISLPRGTKEQAERLAAEGVVLSQAGRIDLRRFRAAPSRKNAAPFSQEEMELALTDLAERDRNVRRALERVGMPR